MTLEATMIENNPELKKMYLAAAAKQESPVLFNYKYNLKIKIKLIKTKILFI